MSIRVLQTFANVTEAERRVCLFVLYWLKLKGKEPTEAETSAEESPKLIVGVMSPYPLFFYWSLYIVPVTVDVSGKHLNIWIISLSAFKNKKISCLSLEQ